QSRQLSQLQHLDVLIADDSEIARDNLAEVAASIGWTPTPVNGGNAAIQTVQQHASDGSPFDVLLLDWRMPDLDGLEVASRLRKEKSTQKTPIILVATAYSREELSQHPDIASIDGILPKPVTSSSLYNAVQDAMHRKQGDLQAHPTASGPKRLQGVRVLAVDDNEFNRDVVERILSFEGAQVILAGDGKSALDLLSKNEGKIDVILMDVQMPIMDGYEASREIRTNPSYQALPIVALTAGAFSAQQQAAKEAGMDAFVPKPFDVEVLVNTVSRLGKKDSKISPVPPSEAPTSQSEGGNHSVRPLIDAARGVSIWKNEELFHDSLLRFIRGNRDMAEQIEQAYQKKDITKVDFLAHKLKGVAGNLSLPRLSDAAAEIEKRAHQGEDPALQIPRLREVLSETIEAVMDVAHPEPLPSPILKETVDSETLAKLLQELASALDSDNHRTILAAMAPLEGILPSMNYQELFKDVDAYNFRQAEESLKKVALALHVPLQIKGGNT
ncbi:MAG TPA: response regulator, partial [Fibrobacteraceae bacterium]|nr:response regulator [Fibrobacteraceae bacterium]